MLCLANMNTVPYSSIHHQGYQAGSQHPEGIHQLILLLYETTKSSNLHETDGKPRYNAFRLVASCSFSTLTFGSTKI